MVGLTLEQVLLNIHEDQSLIIGYFGPGIINYPRVFELKYYLKGTATECQAHEKFDRYQFNEVESLSARFNDEENKTYIIVSVHGNNKSN